jgi:ubiquinone/menaquinone biosynthesis C-methylase UbiE
MTATSERNPQAAQMADESMIRTLAHQVEAIWPQESRLYSRYALPAGAEILDVGCGTGEATLRLSAIFPGASRITGLDLMPELLSVAQGRLGERATTSVPEIRFEQGDGFDLPFDDESVDLLVCRHVTQLVPDAKQLLTEFRRVLRPGGWIHVLSEDYGLLHFPPRAGVDPDRLWHEAVVPFTAATGTDARIGRKTLPILRELGFSHTSVQYLIIDTERVPRETLAGIFIAWRDGYAEALAEHSKLELANIRQLFDAVIHGVLDPASYGVWQIPVVAGRKA